MFCDKQDKVDALFKQLLEVGYPSAVLHGGMDQLDRDDALASFKVCVTCICSVLCDGINMVIFGSFSLKNVSYFPGFIFKDQIWNLSFRFCCVYILL